MSNEKWLTLSLEIQDRLLSNTPLEIESAKKLLADVKKCLLEAHENSYLTSGPHTIYSKIKLDRNPKDKKNPVYTIQAGPIPKNFKRDKSLPHFERKDGGWFDFSIIVDEGKYPAQVIGYDFELRLPEMHKVEFIRFDLNVPDHDNKNDGMRFHLHPGHDDLMIHGAPMKPIEILHLFLYDLYLTDKPRAS